MSSGLRKQDEEAVFVKPKEENEQDHAPEESHGTKRVLRGRKDGKKSQVGKIRNCGLDDKRRQSKLPRTMDQGKQTGVEVERCDGSFP